MGKEEEVTFELAEYYFCLNSKGERITFRCLKRTGSMITLEDVNFRKVVKVKIYVNNDSVEYCYPLGKYISKPMLFASDKSDKTF